MVDRADSEGELRRIQVAWQFEEGERVSARFGDDPDAHPLVERPDDHRVEQGCGVGVRKTADAEFRETVERIPLFARIGRIPHCEDHPDALRGEAPGDERQRLRRRGVDPLRIVEDAEKGRRLSHLREEAEHGETDEEPIRGLAGARPERRAERLLLGFRKVGDAVQERSAQLMEHRIRELDLRLHARRPGDDEAVRTLNEVTEQGGLADSCLAPKHQHFAAARDSAGQKLVQLLALAASASQFAALLMTRHGHPPPAPTLGIGVGSGKTWPASIRPTGSAARVVAASQARTRPVDRSRSLRIPGR